MMSLQSRRELAAAVSVHYRDADKSHKSQALDEFMRATGYNRKYAIRALAKASRTPATDAPGSHRRRRRRTYGSDVEQALVRVWKLSGGLCAKRLVPFLGEFIEALERFGQITLCPTVRLKLLAMSVSTASRLLSQARRSREHGISTTLAGTLLRSQIPIRTFEDWNEDRPGFMEIDLVAHCGACVAGEYCYTLTMTDIATGWTECVAVPNRGELAVGAGIELVRRRVPFALLGIDSDNGTEFINWNLKRWCDRNHVTFTRCRPYKKNDQCHVEQKNGALVRPLIGYARYTGQQACDALNRIYDVHRLCVNFFEPSMKLIGKTRVGSKLKKSYDKAQTPWQRLRTNSALDEDAKEAIKQTYLTLNPAKLRRSLYALEIYLGRLAAPEPAFVGAYPSRQGDDHEA
jgi:hypothetical protein